MHIRRRNLHEDINNVIDEVKVVEHTVTEFVKTLSWAELEEWQKDNRYILRGYRRAQNSWKGCFHSVFGYLHNETVNIHSHLWGAVLFFILLLTNHTLVLAKYPTVTWLDFAVFSVFLSAAVFCLTSSSFYHMAGAHSEHIARRCNALDYSGIVVLIVGSFLPSIYYLFFCHLQYQNLYISLIVLSGIAAAYIVLDPEYCKPSHRGARTKVFIGLGLSAIIPFTHALFTHGLSTLRNEMGIDFLFLTGALYIGGALLYANRIPERFSPGTFDYFFSSHQLFHFTVVLAALSHYASILSVADYRHMQEMGVCTL